MCFIWRRQNTAASSDPMVTHASNKQDGSIAVIDEQSRAGQQGAESGCAWQRLLNARRLVLFWNHPPGEKNLSPPRISTCRAAFVSTLQTAAGSRLSNPAAG